MKPDSSTATSTGINGQLQVSVIVPTFNRSNYIEECLDSLLSQTIPPFEIIVIDDGSEDDTADRLVKYNEKIRYFRKENGGKASAINLALTKTRGDIVWLFDDDDVAMPTAIESRTEILLSNPSADFVYSPHYLGFNDSANKIVRGKLHDTPSHTKDVFLREILKGCFFHLATALIRKKVFDTIGGFDTALIRAQDYDFQIRMAQVATPAFCPSPSFIFRQHDGVRGTKLLRHKSSEREEFFLKYDQVIGKKIRKNLQIGEYLISRKNGDLTQDEYREALFARMVVMGTKGCIPEMLADLASALGTVPPGECLTREERETITSLIYTGYTYPAYRQNRKRSRDLIADLPDFETTKKAKRCLARGFIRLSRLPQQTFRERWGNIKEALLLMKI